ncbi:amidohydrolase [Salinihabitans flavidus]|uniref:Peptidase M20 domain-containing protein 2 n=1 Tax=Salinihabitans flavidus TaxID=569882 RepID=A0A1H8VNF7_9RHOB|nr:M20 family metallopeptidase [Salinihabitans flavidus]SEP16747.1 amidohydrolase [Salinihabitans flavidus]
MRNPNRPNRAKDLKARACAAIDTYAAGLIECALDLHAHPEIAFEEVRSSAALAERLRDAGLEVTLPAYGLDTAFVAEFGTTGPVLGIVAEYDALPGLGHACGHNVIGTSALGAVLGLAELGEDLPGRIRLLGTPAEEGGGGKVIMAREGAFDGLDCAMMVHPADRNLPSFPLIAAAWMTATFHGRSAHAAATPEAGINALDGLVTAYNAIAALRQQIPGDHRVHAIIREGGTATNIIPDRAVGAFGLRAPSRKALEELKTRVTDCLNAGASASGAQVEIVDSQVQYHELISNAPIAERFRINAEALGHTFEAVENLSGSNVASTDFGNVSHLIPAIHPMMATVPRGTAFHTPDFALHSASDAAMSAMLDAAKAMAMTAIDILCDTDLRTSMKKAFVGATAHA